MSQFTFHQPIRIGNCLVCGRDVFACTCPKQPDPSPEALVEEVARVICYWSYRDCGRSCGDNYCVTKCVAVSPDDEHYKCARDLLAKFEIRRRP